MPRSLVARTARSALQMGALAALIAAGTSACGPQAQRASSSGRAVSAQSAPDHPKSTPLISPKRCALNKAAGTVTYLTGFQWQASVGILDPIAAQALGYYKDMCLRVTLRPGTGDPVSSGGIVASGRATFTEFGSPSDAITDVAGTPSIPVDAVATYGNTTASTLLTMPSITNLRQLDGKTIGYKGAMPPIITAMLEKAGVKISSLKEVAVGYDPTILPRGQVQALTAYKSNEPLQLRDEGFKVREWNPDQFGLHGAFNIFDVNRGFARAHPTAVEDFLRATFKAFYYCQAHAKSCVDFATKYEISYPVNLNLQRWRVESSEVLSTLLPGHGVGYEDKAQWQPDYSLLRRYKLISHPVALGSIINPTYVDAIYHGRTLIWPAP